MFIRPKHIQIYAIASIFTIGPTLCMAEPYLTGAIGNTGWKKDLKKLDNSLSFEMGGGFQFNPYLAAEFTYLDSGKGSLKTPDFDLNFRITGFTCNLVGILPINDGLSVYGKAGAFAWKMKRREDIDFTNYSGGSDTNGTDFILGLGAAYIVAKDISLYTEYRTFAASTYDGEDVDIGFTSISFGAKYQF